MSDYNLDAPCEKAGEIVGTVVKTGVQEIHHALKAGWSGTKALLRGIKNAEPQPLCPRRQLNSEDRKGPARSPRAVGQRDLAQEAVDINNEVCLEEHLRSNKRWPYVEAEVQD